MRTEAITYKSLYFFYAAALSLLSCGILISENSATQNIILLLCCISGVFAIYRLNDFIDSEWNLKNNLHYFFKNGMHVLFIILFAGVTIPLAITFLSPVTFAILGISGVVGSLYSLKFRFKGFVFRIKNTFVLKNICIGAVWGGLVLIGAGGFNHPLVIHLFLFAFAQVFIGSAIRDIPDIKKDILNKVKTLPNIYGEKKTLFILFVLNILSYLTFWQTELVQYSLIICVPVIAWRTLNLYKLYQHPHSRFWGQEGNLLTCLLIFIMLFISLL